MIDTARPSTDPAPSTSTAAGPDPLLIDARAVARLLSISVATVWRLEAAGKLPAPLKLAGSTRWRSAELREWIDAGCPDRREWHAMQSPAQPSGRPRR